MKATAFLTALGLCGLSFVAAKEPVRAKPAAVNPAFDTSLYQLLAQKDGNVFFSPYSISECMGMVYAGTGGNTATEIAKALSYGKDSKLTAAEFKAMRAHLARSINKGENKLSIANGLCVTGRVPLQSFQDLVREQFEGELFSGGLAEINGWVSKKTEGRIPEILSELSGNSACVLLNAVYFKGNWQAPFSGDSTRKAPFHVAANDTVEVDMMMNDGHYRVLRNNGLIAVELPYETGASMVCIMPDKADGMKALENKLSAPMLDATCKLLSAAPWQNIDLYLPKFKIATSYNLVGPMQQLGIKDAFSFDSSDFKAMYGDSMMSIAQIVHKATLEVDEKGSVAAAATAVEIEFLSAVVEEPVKVKFDRPFLVLIRDRESGTNLFMGRINDPTK